MAGHSNPYGNTSPQNASPLPQGYAGGGAGPVRIVNGFTQFLPGATRLFFQRQYFSNYPRPIQPAGVAAWPRAVPVASIQAPAQQAIVVITVSFRAYEHSGIGVEDLSEVPKGKAVGTLGFSFSVGNRGLTDYQTNLPGTSIPVAYAPVQVGFGATAPRAGQGSVFQGTGPITPQGPNQPFAAYARPGDLIKADAVVFRPPGFDLRVFEVEFGGWLANEAELDKILNSLSR
jgi:hypothetical protein